jgi:hypothetical protein
MSLVFVPPCLEKLRRVLKWQLPETRVAVESFEIVVRDAIACLNTQGTLERAEKTCPDHLAPHSIKDVHPTENEHAPLTT